MLEEARQYYVLALHKQELNSTKETVENYESALRIVNNLSYYPGIDENAAYVELETSIIDDYKNFLPWCINSKILTIDKNEENLKITADLEIGFKTFREVYTSKVLYNNNTSKIEVTSVSGNIKKLSNTILLLINLSK